MTKSRGLTAEQQFMLHRIALEIQSLSRDELHQALLDCWEARFRQKQSFIASAKEAGFSFQFNEGIAVMGTAPVYPTNGNFDDMQAYHDSLVGEVRAIFQASYGFSAANVANW